MKVPTLLHQHFATYKHINIMRKTLIIISCISMIIIVVLGAYYAYSCKQINYNYDHQNLTANVVKKDFGQLKGDVHIPSQIVQNGINYTVQHIDEDAFANATRLSAIELPNSITRIGSWAFSNTGIYNNKENWQNKALYLSQCLIAVKTSIQGEYTIHPHTRIIAGGAFWGCTAINSINIPESVIDIGDRAFVGCTSITHFTIPNSVKRIGYSAFADCTSLKSITIGTGITNIERFAFINCEDLRSINYLGTQAQWNKIHTGSYWRDNTSVRVVHCIDGEVEV